MNNWNDINNGDIVKCNLDGSIYSVMIWRGEKYITGNSDMWNVNEFDSEDFEKIS